MGFPSAATFRSTALCLASAAAGVFLVDAGVSASSPPASPPVAGCAEVTALLDGQVAAGVALVAGDPAAVTASVDALEDLAAAAETAVADETIASALTEVAAQAAAWSAAIAAAPAPADIPALQAAVAAVPQSDGLSAAATAVFTWASTTCGYVAPQMAAPTPTPPPCTDLDAAAAATAAGLDVDVAAGEAPQTLTLGGFSVSSCAFGDGALRVATMAFLDPATAVDNWNGIVAETEATVLTPELGTLPATTIITQRDTTVTVAVFDATVAFNVAVTGDAVDPASVVAAAEAVLAALPAPAGTAAGTDVATTIS